MPLLGFLHNNNAKRNQQQQTISFFSCFPNHLFSPFMQNHQRSPIFDFSGNASSSFHQQYRYSNILNDAVVIATNAGSISEDEDPLPSFEEFQGIINDYLQNLSPKKRDKALVDHARYCLIQEVLKNPRNTSISTAQFRFWVKKMFQLQPGSYDLVCHDNKPVAMREQIYDILVNAHKEAHHGGRDKTSAIVSIPIILAFHQADLYSVRFEINSPGFPKN